MQVLRVACDPKQTLDIGLTAALRPAKQWPMRPLPPPPGNDDTHLLHMQILYTYMKYDLQLAKHDESSAAPIGDAVHNP